MLNVSRRDSLLKPNHANVMKVCGSCKIRVAPKATPSDFIIEMGKLAMKISCEVVDALLDNGICRQPIRDDHNRVYKSLSDVIEGKEGRVRETLLGKWDDCF
ncbi:RNA polymerase beta subunit [Tanacetum coccineum]